MKAQATRNAGSTVDDTPGGAMRRHPLLLAVGLAAFLMFGYGGYLASQMMDPAAFPIKKFAVEGEFVELDVEHVQQLVSQAVDGGFFAVDVGIVRDRILDEPWVRGAGVRRVWPDTIRVSISEQKAVARWGDYGLLNDDADIFVPNEIPQDAELAILDGPIGSEAELLRNYLEIHRMLGDIGLRVSRVSLNERRAWEVDVENGARLIIGRNAIAARLKMFVRAYEQILKPEWGKVALVDLRYTNGFAVREKTTIADNG